jgi:hypothetical protein
MNMGADARSVVTMVRDTTLRRRKGFEGKSQIYQEFRTYDGKEGDRKAQGWIRLMPHKIRHKK